MAWSGAMELYIKYDPEDDFPQKLEGVVTWPDLGHARTSISGDLRADGSLNFNEVSCIEGDCSKIVLGGSYAARIKGSGEQVSGTANGPYNLRGKFELRRAK